MLLWGAFAYLAWLVPPDLAQAVAKRLAPMRVAAIRAAVVATVATLQVETAVIGEGWPDALRLATVTDVLTGTSVGAAWLAQMAAVIFLLAGTAALPSSSWPTAIGAGASLATLALTGHAAMQEGWLGVLHRLNDAAHLLVGGAWLGALVPLILILDTPETAAAREQAKVALRRFSAAGHGAVALVIATGAANTFLTLGKWPIHWSSAYQALLAAKIVLVAAMTSLAVANRYVLVPRLASSPTRALGELKVLTGVEIALGLLAISLVSVFGMLEPA